VLGVLRAGGAGRGVGGDALHDLLDGERDAAAEEEGEEVEPALGFGDLGSHRGLQKLARSAIRNV
jgi:hypothetical protein